MTETIERDFSLREWITGLALITNDAPQAFDALCDDPVDIEAAGLVALDAVVRALREMRDDVAKHLGHRMAIDGIDRVETSEAFIDRDRKSASRSEWDNDQLARDVRRRFRESFAVTDEGEAKPVDFDELWNAVTDVLPVRGYNMSASKIRSLDLDPDDYAHTVAGYSVAKIVPKENS